MLRPALGSLRAARAAALAVVVLGISAVAHVAGGGGTPGFGLLVALGLPVLGACLVLTRRRLTVGRSVAVMGTGQLVLHHVFMAACPMRQVMPSVHISVGHPVLMLAAHAVATSLLAATFAAGDDSLWRLWCWLTPRHLLVLDAPHVPEVRCVDAVESLDPLVPAERAHAVGRRGPPVLLAV